MYTVRISEHLVLKTFSWHVRCPANCIIMRGVTRYKTRGIAVRWAKYWAEKISFTSIEFKGTR